MTRTQPEHRTSYKYLSLISLPALSFQAQSGLLFPKDYKDMEAKKKRKRRMTDPELEAYAETVGLDVYRKEYERLYNQTKFHTRTYSGKPGNKSKAELEAIKRKYQNGVTRAHINEMVGL